MIEQRRQLAYSLVVLATSSLLGGCSGIPSKDANSSADSGTFLSGDSDTIVGNKLDGDPEFQITSNRPLVNIQDLSQMDSLYHYSTEDETTPILMAQESNPTNFLPIVGGSQETTPQVHEAIQLNQASPVNLEEAKVFLDQNLATTAQVNFAYERDTYSFKECRILGVLSFLNCGHEFLIDLSQIDQSGQFQVESAFQNRRNLVSETFLSNALPITKIQVEKAGNFPQPEAEFQNLRVEAPFKFKNELYVLAGASSAYDLYRLEDNQWKSVLDMEVNYWNLPPYPAIDRLVAQLPDSLLFEVAVQVDEYGAQNHLFSFDGHRFRQIENAGGGHQQYNQRIQSENEVLTLSKVRTDGAIRNKIWRFRDDEFYAISNFNPEGSDEVEHWFVHQDRFYLDIAGETLVYHNDAFHHWFDTNPNGADSIRHVYSAQDGRLYFSAINENGYRKLFVSDGSSAAQISNTQAFGDDDPRFWVEYEGKKYFRLKDQSASDKIYRLENQNLIQVIDIYPGESQTLYTPTVFQGRVYFSMRNEPVYDPSHNTYDLYSFGADGVKRHTQLRSATTQIRLKTQEALYIKASIDTETNLSKLFRFDGREIFQLTNINPNGNDSIGVVVKIDDDIFFTAKDTNGDRLLYKIKEY